jgi:hypothetical protein
MRRLPSIGAFLIGIACASFAIAQNEAYVPTLGDIMNMAQWRHIKLWFAGKLQNWDLARYELRQIKASLEDAVVFYHGIPVQLVDATVDPIRAIDAAIEVKDGARFVEGYHALTSACNACHVGIGRSFIVIQVPTTLPFSDQSFSPSKPGAMSR